MIKCVDTCNIEACKCRVWMMSSVNSLNETESAIVVSLMCFLHPEQLHSELVLSSLQLVLCRVATVNRLPVHRQSADYIFSDPLGSLGLF